MRTHAVADSVPLVTTVMAAKSVVTALAALHHKRPDVRTIQEYNAETRVSSVDVHTSAAARRV